MDRPLVFAAAKDGAFDIHGEHGAWLDIAICFSFPARAFVACEQDVEATPEIM